MNAVLDLLAGFMLLAGLFFVAVAAVGVLRLPDVYCRAHALSKAMTLGIICLLVAFGLRVPDASWLKIGSAILFQFVTIPVASHLLCLVAYRRQLARSPARAGAAKGTRAGRE